MSSRRLTVSSASAESRAAQYPCRLLAPMPLLRLRGRWLKHAGFEIGSTVQVSVSAGRLVLEVEPPGQAQS
ncbi:MAG: SymE family type I addiction module toxin [Steroidobacteraceae bacterium]